MRKYKITARTTFGMIEAFGRFGYQKWIKSGMSRKKTQVQYM